MRELCDKQSGKTHCTIDVRFKDQLKPIIIRNFQFICLLREYWNTDNQLKVDNIRRCAQSFNSTILEANKVWENFMIIEIARVFNDLVNWFVSLAHITIISMVSTNHVAHNYICFYQHRVNLYVNHKTEMVDCEGLCIKSQWSYIAIWDWAKLVRSLYFIYLFYFIYLYVDTHI